MTKARNNPTRPVVAVGAVVFKDDKILLIRRGKAPKAGEWSLPGGAQELCETVKEAVLREVKEETGLTVALTGLLDVVDFIEAEEENMPSFHYTLIDYGAEYVAGTLKADSDAADARFFLLEEALALPLWSETKRIIELAAERRQI